MLRIFRRDEPAEAQDDHQAFDDVSATNPDLVRRIQAYSTDVYAEGEEPRFDRPDRPLPDRTEDARLL